MRRLTLLLIVTPLLACSTADPGAAGDARFPSAQEGQTLFVAMTLESDSPVDIEALRNELAELDGSFHSVFEEVPLAEGEDTYSYSVFGREDPLTGNRLANHSRFTAVAWIEDADGEIVTSAEQDFRAECGGACSPDGCGITSGVDIDL